MIMLINGVHCSTSGCGYRRARRCLGQRSVPPSGTSIWAAIFTQCVATKMMQIDLLNTPTGLPRGAGAGRSSPESETTLRGHGYTSEDGATALTEVLSNAAAQINKPFEVLPCDQSEQRAETALACAR